MSEVNLLIFGCVVSFIAAAGAYVYFEEAAGADVKSRDSKAHRSDGEHLEVREGT